MRGAGRDTFPDKAGESTLMSRSGREKGLRLSGAGDSMFLSSEAGMSGDFLGASRVSSPVSNFKRERGISLEMLQKERASSRDDGGNLVVFLELRRDSRITTWMGQSPGFF